VSNLGPGLPNLPTGPARADASPATFASSVTIEEIQGAQGSPPRVVVLSGPSLPFQGAAWGGKNALVTEWNPGNGDEATQQDLGPQELPSQWQGMWNRTLMGKHPARSFTGGAIIDVVDPDSLVNLLEDIYRGGLRLRVTWTLESSNEAQSVSGKKVREGRAGQWEFKYTRLQDIAWSTAFEWQSRGRRVQTVTSVRDGTASAVSAGANVLMANLRSKIETAKAIASNPDILNSASTLSLGQLEAIANGPSELVAQLQRSTEQLQTQLKQAAGIAETLATQPLAVETTLTNIAKNAKATFLQFQDNMAVIPLEYKSQNQTVADLLRAHQYFSDVENASEKAATAALIMIAQLERKRPPAPGAGQLSTQGTSASIGNVLAVYSCRDGDTPQKISQRYYGSPDHAVDILQANRLPWSQPSFRKGAVLIIPVLRSTQPSA
jgi:hypothetical protein